MLAAGLITLFAFGPAEPAKVPVQEVLTVTPGAARCLEAERLHEQLLVWLEDGQVDARLRIEVWEDERSPSTAHVELFSDGGSLGTRILEPLPTDCAAATAALGLAIAFTLDATVLEDFDVPPAEGPVPAEAPVPTNVDPPEPVAAAEIEDDEPPADEAFEAKAALELGPVLTIGLTPRPSLGGAIGMRLDLGDHLGLDLGAEVHQGFRAELGIGEVSQRLVLGRLGLCGGGPAGRLDLRGCATGYGGALWVDGHGYEVDARAREPWLAVGLGLRLRAPLGRRFAFFTSLDGIVPLTRIEPEIVDSSGGDDRLVQTASPVGGRLSAGLSIQFD